MGLPILSLKKNVHDKQETLTHTKPTASTVEEVNIALILTNNEHQVFKKK